MRGDRRRRTVFPSAARLAAALILFAPPHLSATSLSLGERGAGLVGVFLTLVLLGIGLVSFARPALEIVSDTVAHSLGRSFVVGLLAQVLVLPTLAVLVAGLALTVVGILLVPFVVVVGVLLVAAALGLGLLATGHAMGERWTRRQMAMGQVVSPNSYRYLAVGLVLPAAVWIVWGLFGGIPYAGPVVLAGAMVSTWLLLTMGLGATILSRAGVRGEFAGRLVPPEALTDEYLWATPQLGVPAVKRPEKQ